MKAGNANDTAAGSGARAITVQVLDETGALVEETVATAGASASAVTTVTAIRLLRAWVSSSGTYASSTAGSHAAAIVIENGAGGTTWGTIDATAFPKGRTQIGAYSVPLGKTALIQKFMLTTGSNKPVDFILFSRKNILETAAPYTTMNAHLEMFGLSRSFNSQQGIPFGPFPALTDFGFMVKGATTPNVTVDFEILLENA